MNDFPLFDRIVPEGKAMAHWHDKALFCIGPLPGETARVQLTREKKRWAEAMLEEIITASPHRHPAEEGHFLACSPWQGVDYGYQLELKRKMLEELYSRPELTLAIKDFIAAPKMTGYRNKLEFSLVLDQGQLELAFHVRGTFNDFVPAPDGCVLGSPAMNKAAATVIASLNDMELQQVAQTLIVREDSAGRIIVVVTLRQKAPRDLSALAEMPVDGIVVALKSTTDAHKLLWSHGIDELTETVGGITVAYPWDAFFQVNPAAFDNAFKDIVRHIDPEHFVADLYGGAGTIGLPVAGIANKVVGIEISASAVELANANALRNGLTNYKAFATRSETMDPETIRGVDTVIVDPPRAGLHALVIDFLKQAQPKRIIYLSCNPVTQVRDLLLLDDEYKVIEVTGYDFYPGTLHMESLAVLDRR